MKKKEKTKLSPAEHMEKARAARKTITYRKYEDTPAGHMADRLQRVLTLVEKIASRVGSWNAGTELLEKVEADPDLKSFMRPWEVLSHLKSALATTAIDITSQLVSLNSLDEFGFRPKAKARGSKKLDVVPGMSVWLKPKAYAEFLAEGFTVEQLDKLVLGKYANNMDPMLLVRVEKSEPGYPSLGHIHRKNLSPVRPDYDAPVAHEEATEEAEKTAA